MTENNLIITIDGPSGVGKSSVAKSVAKILGLTYLDTGAMYRAVALLVSRNRIDINNEQNLSDILNSTNIKFEQIGHENYSLMLNNEDVSRLIRTPEISALASDVATKKTVRTKLVELQQQIGCTGNIVADGRDMGTYVFPDADYKFYLDATVPERVKRRWKQLLELGHRVDIEEVKKEIETRDIQDRGRSESPLHPALNAVIIDTTYISANEVINRIINIVRSE